MVGKDRSVKLVMIITGLSTGGAEMMLLNLLKHIDRGRFSPHVFSLTTKGEVAPRIKALGIPVETLGMRTDRPNLTEFLRLVRRLRELKPDVVHTWMYHADVLGGLAARLAGVRALCWGLRSGDAHLLRQHKNKDSDIQIRLKRSTQWMVNASAVLSSRIPKKILSCAQSTANAHERYGYDGKKIVVIPNGFDTLRFVPDLDAYSTVRWELGLPEDTPIVGLIARFHPVKNHVGFLEVTSRIRRSRPDAHFLLAGEGVDADNAELQRKIQTLGLAGNTHLLGRREDVPRLMAALDVLVSASFAEGFPNVPGEAMACGIPCVVTDVGDSAEMVGETGRVAKQGDIEGLARGVLDILSLSSEERQELSEKSRKRIRAKYSIKSIARQHEEFYESLVE